MPRRALIEKRPYLLASIAAAVAFFFLRETSFPGLYLIVLRAGAMALLAIYAFQRHDGQDAKLIGGSMAAAAASTIALNFVPIMANLLDFASIALALGVFLKAENRPHDPSRNQRIMALVLFLGTPAMAWILSGGAVPIFYGLLPGAMAAGAWISRFARHHVGTGAVMIVLSELLIVTPQVDPTLGWISYMIEWPLYYFGQFLICTGVIQTLNKSDKITRIFH